MVGYAWGNNLRSISTAATLTHPTVSYLLIDLDVGDLAACVLLPDIHHIIEAGDVAFRVVADLPDDGVELAARFHRFGDLLRIERVRRLRRLLDDLHRGGGVERVGFRLEVLGAELVNDRLGLRALARVGAVGHQRAFNAWPTDGGELVRGDAVAAHQRRIDALVAHLPHDQAAFGMQPTPIDELGARGLDLGDDCREIL